MLTPPQILRANVMVLDRAVKAKDTRLLMGRVLRQTGGIRKQLDGKILSEFVSEVLPQEAAGRTAILQALQEVRSAPLRPSPMPSPLTTLTPR